MPNARATIKSRRNEKPEGKNAVNTAAKKKDIIAMAEQNNVCQCSLCP